MGTKIFTHIKSENGISTLCGNRLLGMELLTKKFPSCEKCKKLYLQKLTNDE